MAVEVPPEFVNFLRTESERGKDSSLDDKRATAIDFYHGRPFGDETEGRSQAVTRDVSEVIDFLTVGILGTIIASGKVVEFESEPEQIQGEDGQPTTVDYGEQATAVIQWAFMRRRPGYLGGYKILHDSLKAGLMEMTGVVKTYVEAQPPIHEQHLVTADEIEMGDGGFSHQGRPIVASDPADEGWQPGMPSELHRITLKQPQPPKFCDAPVPNEFFRVAPDAIDLDSAVYVGERMPKTLSDLVQLGYDRAELETIWGNPPESTQVENARDAERSQTRNSVGQRVGADKQLWLDEEYALYDLDGDGIAERLFVHRIGSTVLRVEPVDEQPYSIWSPFPMPHRLIGQSVADKTMDIQRIRSVLLRQALDSLYLSNAPRTLVDEQSITVDTIDDLLTVRPGGLIRFRGTAPQPLEQRDTSQTSFNAMEMMSAERESRTGITRQSQGLNPDTLNKTASGMAMLQQNSQQIELYVTRNFAEMIVMSVFAKRYRLMRAHGQPFRMKIQGKYTTIDPRQWPEEIDMSINVGLGTGNKDQKLQYRMSLLGIQQQIAAVGWPIVGQEEVYQNVKALVEDSGLGTASDYVKDPATIPEQPQQPHPDVVKAQMEAQAQQAKDGQAHQQAMAKLQLQQEAQRADAALKAQANDQDMRIKAEAATQASNLANAKAAEEARLAQQRADREFDLAVQTQQRNYELAKEAADHKHELAMRAATLPADRPGGNLAQ
jgi:hypothetical protein